MSKRYFIIYIFDDHVPNTQNCKKSISITFAGNDNIWQDLQTYFLNL